VTLTLTLDRVTLHTVVHHLSTSTYMPNFIEIIETICGRTYGRTDGRTFETHFIKSTYECNQQIDRQTTLLGLSNRPHLAIAAMQPNKQAYKIST